MLIAMSNPAVHPESSSVVELESRATVCVVPGCGGAVVRHSLGGGQSVHRCMRCFRRYEVTGARVARAFGRSRLRQLIDEFVSWRE
jgi:hypothetical protein